MPKLLGAVILAGLASLALLAGQHDECTTAVITAQATAEGRPILWKNRDTDKLSNKVVYVSEKPYSYLALVDAQTPSGRFAWAGLNQSGFAIINSVAYNLPQKAGEAQDYEGLVMADALRTCASVVDFENYLRRNLGPDLGSRTNFCVIDADGGAAIFETHNHGFERLDAEASPEKYLLNTNFSRSGRADEGAGYLRFDRERELFSQGPARAISVEFILQTAARDLGHPLIKHLPASEWRNLPADRPYWVHANYTINRVSTASVAVVQGVGKGENPGKATLWVILGEPVCSIAVPLWVTAGDPPAELREGVAAAFSREAMRLKDLLRPLKGRERREYVDVTRLDNQSGSGWLPANLELERKILAETQTFLGTNPTAEQMSAFEREMVTRALARLREVR